MPFPKNTKIGREHERTQRRTDNQKTYYPRRPQDAQPIVACTTTSAKTSVSREADFATDL